MDLELDGKRALVTGSTGGIGEAIAVRLAAEGASVIVHGRPREAGDRVAGAIVAAGGQASVALADLTADDQVAGLADAVGQTSVGVDVLVNNAGAYAKSSWWTATSSDWLSLYANVVAAVRLIRAFVPAMRDRGFGRVILLASGEATQPFAFMPDYAATKAALVNLTVSLARELAGSGVTANTVSPGIVVTAGVEAFYRAEADARGWGSSWSDIEAGVLREVLPNSAGRLGRVEEIADLVAFLASPRAGYITGANFRIDGGSTTSDN